MYAREAHCEFSDGSQEIKQGQGRSCGANPRGRMGAKCSESDLETLVSAGLLPEKSVIQWHPALGEDRPYENTAKIVTFAP